MEEDATREPEPTGHVERSEPSEEPDAAHDLRDMPKWLSDAWEVHQAHLEAAETGPAVSEEHMSEASAPSDDAWRLMEEAAELRRALRAKDVMVDELRAQLNPPEPDGKENSSNGDLAGTSHKLVARRSGAAELAPEEEASHEQVANELWGTPGVSSLAGARLRGASLQGPRPHALALQEEIEVHQVRGQLEGCRLELQAEARKHCPHVREPRPGPPGSATAPARLPCGLWLCLLE